MHNGPVSNAFVVQDLKIFSQCAVMLGRSEDAERYQRQYDLSRESYIRHFIRKDGRMKDDYQAAYIMALSLVLPEGELPGLDVSDQLWSNDNLGEVGCPASGWDCQ